LNFVEFVGECLIKNYEERPLAVEIFEHPFLQGVPKNPTYIKKSLIEKIQENASIRTKYEATVRKGQLKLARKEKSEPMDKVYFEVASN